MVVCMIVLADVKLDIIVIMCLSMNIGLVVDYSTHTAYAYLTNSGSPEEKLHSSISKMGASVLSGGGSTFLGISALIFASSKGFRLFFYVLGSAVFFGTLAGITVSPFLLYVVHRLVTT